MLTVDIALAFFAASLLLGIAPGPDNIFVLTQSAVYGAGAGMVTTLGLVTGLCVHTTAVALGVAAILAAEPMLFALLRLAGAAYLVWLGLGALRAAWRGEAGIAPAAPSAGAAPRFQGGHLRGQGRIVLQGMLTNLLNPKVALFFLAFLPQFVAPGLAPAWLQMLLLGPLLPLLAVPLFAVLIAGAGRAVSRLNRSARATRWLNGLAGTIFLGLGLRLLLDRR